MSRLNHTFVTLAFCLWEWVAAHCIQSKIICFERAAKCYSVAVWSLCGLWVATLSGQTVLHVCDLSFCLWEWVAAHCIQVEIICFERAAKCYSAALWSVCGLWVATLFFDRQYYTLVTLAFCLWEWVAAHCIQSKIICFERAAKCYSVAVWSLCGLWVATLSGQTVLHVCDLGFLSVRMSCSSLYTGRNYLFWTSCKVLLCGLVECLDCELQLFFWTDSTTRLWPWLFVCENELQLIVYR